MGLGGHDPQRQYQLQTLVLLLLLHPMANGNAMRRGGQRQAIQPQEPGVAAQRGGQRRVGGVRSSDMGEVGRKRVLYREN